MTGSMDRATSGVPANTGGATTGETWPEDEGSTEIALLAGRAMAQMSNSNGNLNEFKHRIDLTLIHLVIISD